MHARTSANDSPLDERTHRGRAGSRATEWVAMAWLATYGVVGVMLALWYPDSYQQDGGTHFLFARDAWHKPALLVDVWGRPLFTTLYAIPARFGYLPAKLLTVAVCLAAAWQTWRWAQDEGMSRAELAIPFFALQPSVLLLTGETMTEPLLALVFVVALRLHRAGCIVAGAIVASLMPLARPEGFFLCLLWGVWLLADGRLAPAWWRRAMWLPALVVGVAAWWLVALVLTRDPAFILHNWPHNWAPTGAVYGRGPWLDYWRQRYEIIARALFAPFVLGLIALIARRRLGTATSAVLLIFAVHSVLRHYGLFGSAGYPRYFVCIAPAFAVIVLAGWNLIADAVQWLIARLSSPWRILASAAAYLAAALVLFLGTRAALYYVDDRGTSRDALAIEKAESWLRAHPVPVRELVWSQAYMCITLDCDTRRRVIFSGDHARDLATLRSLPAETLVFWDGETGPNWYDLHGADFAAAGFRRLFDQNYELAARFQRRIRYPAPWLRSQEMMFYYKDAKDADATSAQRVLSGVASNRR